MHDTTNCTGSTFISTRLYLKHFKCMDVKMKTCVTVKTHFGTMINNVNSDMYVYVIALVSKGPKWTEMTNDRIIYRSVSGPKWSETVVIKDQKWLHTNESADGQLLWWTPTRHWRCTIVLKWLQPDRQFLRPHHSCHDRAVPVLSTHEASISHTPCLKTLTEISVTTLAYGLDLILTMIRPI